MRFQKGLTLAELLVVLTILCVCVVLFLPIPHCHSIQYAKETACANHLKQLHAMMWNYRVLTKSMPDAIGHGFWRTLSSTTPPLIDASMEEIHRCPIGRSGYLGPRRSPADMAEDEIIGADPVGSHRPRCGGNVIRKSGALDRFDDCSELWEAVIRTTTP